MPATARQRQQGREDGEAQHQINKYIGLRRGIDKALSLVNNGKWYDLLRLTYRVEDYATQIILDEENLGRMFDTLRLRIFRNYSTAVKKRACREKLIEIIKLLSRYGLYPVMDSNRETAGVMKNMEAIDNMITNMMPKYSKLGNVGAYTDDIVNDVYMTKQFINSLMSAANSIKTRDPQVKGMISAVVNKAAQLKSNMDYMLSKKEDVKLVFNTRSELYQLITALDNMMKEPERADMEQYLLGEEGITVPSESQAPAPAEVVGQKEFQPGSFDWVDEEWKRVLRHPSIFTIVGARNEGKSQLGYTIMEYYMNQYEVDAYLFSPIGMEIAEKARQLLPKGTKVVDDINDVGNDSVVLFDEAHIAFHSRTSMRDTAMVYLDKVIELTRQKNQSHIYVTQRTSKLDRNIFSGADALLIKKPGKLQVRMERGELKDVLEKAEKEFDRVEKQLGDTVEERKRKRKGYVYVYAEDFEKMKYHGLCSFWSEDLSELFG